MVHATDSARAYDLAANHIRQGTSRLDLPRDDRMHMDEVVRLMRREAEEWRECAADFRALMFGGGPKSQRPPRMPVGARVADMADRTCPRTAYRLWHQVQVEMHTLNVSDGPAWLAEAERNPLFAARAYTHDSAEDDRRALDAVWRGAAGT